ncbi:MAG: VCBS repeat-containing protein, partial [Deltaproteobacteria bacterium]|nr:VCBS repeat-containing protein [Nannocystaceae bacterium]
VRNGLAAPGAGTFAAPRLALADLGTHSGWRGSDHPRLVGDLTGDGRVDLVGFGRAGVIVALNDGRGGFASSQLAVTNFGVEHGWRVDRHPRLLADLTGDGCADIVGCGDAGVWVALNLGNGAFAEARFVLADFGVETGWRVDHHPRLLGDVTGDGRADLIGFGNAGVFVALGNGDSTFAPPNLAVADFGFDHGWRVDQHPRFLADLTGDGRVDIVGFGNAGVWVALNNGDGTFAPPSLAIADFGVDSGWRVGDHPRWLADVTGDGRADVVGFGDAGVWVALNNGDGTFQSPRLVLPDLGRKSNVDTIVREEVVRDHRDSRIEHVFVLMLENRSFDHMLGFSGITGTDAATGEPTVVDGLRGTEGNSFGGRRFTVSRGAADVGPSPGHDFRDALHQMCGPHAAYPNGGAYPEVNNTGFVASLGGREPDAPGNVMACFGPDQLPVLHALAREFVVCDRWFCSMPGPTGPNRMFTHAATSGMYDDSPSHAEIVDAIGRPFGGFEFPGGNIFELMDEHDIEWRVYAGDSLPDVALQNGVSVVDDIRDFEDFAEDLAKPSFDASYVFIEPAYDVFNGFVDGNSQHPRGSVAAGERLIKATYEAIRNSPHWENSLLIITWDEHGGFYDHVVPGSAQPTGETGRDHGFTFQQLGPRVPAVVVSPRIPRNLIEHRRLEHVSILQTVSDIFKLPPLQHARDSVCGVAHLARLHPARTDAPTRLPAAIGQAPRRLARTFRDRVSGDPNELIANDPEHQLPSVLQKLALLHLEVEPNRRAEILARVRSIRTRGELHAYGTEVAALVEAARGTRRSRRTGSPPRSTTPE